MLWDQIPRKAEELPGLLSKAPDHNRIIINQQESLLLIYFSSSSLR